MRIDQIDLRIVRLPLVRPFQTSSSRKAHLDHILVRVRLDGVYGWGECASPSNPYYCPETTETCWHILKDFLAPAVLDQEWASIEDLVELYRLVKGNRFARAGLEMACWDAMARLTGEPLHAILGGTRTEILSGVSLGIESGVEILFEQIDRYLEEGYRRIKLKIAPGWDVDVVRQVRERYPEILLQVDANSAYTLDDLPTLRALDEFDLLLIEQPLAHDDIIDHARLQAALRTPVCLDESIHSADDARKAIELGACRAINIKVSRLGGLLEAKLVHDYCHARGVPVWCGGMHEFGIGRAANVAIASLPGFTLPGDVSGSDKYYAEDIVEPPVLAHGGAIARFQGPGLGVEPNIDRIEAATLRALTIKANEGLGWSQREKPRDMKELNRDGMLLTLEACVLAESPSRDKAALDQLGTTLANGLRGRGASVEILSNARGGGHILARFPGPASKRPALVLGHFDTVWPIGTLEKMPFRIEGDRAYGPGIYDMKAGLTMFLWCVMNPILDGNRGRTFPRPVWALFTSDEEIGSPTSRGLIEDLARQCAYVLVLEPPLADGSLKTARKGVGRFRLDVEGKAAHAGVAPQEGRNAIVELAHQIVRIQELQDLDAGTTLNVGVIQGGTTTNVVPAQASADIDVRVATLAEAERVERALRSLEPITAGTRLAVSGEFNRPPMERSPAIAALFEQARRIGRSIGQELTEGSTGGGSDGNFTAALGIPTLDGLGVRGGGAHADDEHILIDSLPERAALLTALLFELEVEP